MSALQNAQLYRQRILDLAASHGIHHVCVFGSAARGDAGPTSDLDLLVDVETGRSYLDVVACLASDRGDAGPPSRLITDGGVSPYLRTKIFAEATPL